MVAFGVHGAADDAGVMPAAGQQESHAVAAEQTVRFVHALPRRHVVGLGADHERRRTHVVQRHGLSCHGEAVVGEFVVQVEPVQIFAVHLPRHTGAIGVPRHQVHHAVALAFQVSVHRGLEDKILRAQQLERAAHLAAFQHALAVHLGIQHGELAGADEQGKLARLAEIRLRGKQRQAADALVATRRKRRGTDGEQGAADAVAHGLHGRAGHDAGNCVQRAFQPQLHVVVHA